MKGKKIRNICLFLSFFLVCIGISGIWSCSKKNVQAAEKAEKTAVGQMYALEITTGANGVDYSKIDSLMISYQAEGRTQNCIQVIHPKTDEENTRKLSIMSDSAKKLNNLSGETLNDSADKYKFLPYTTKTFLFVPYQQIGTIKSIRVLFAKGSTDRWSIQGMRVVKVDAGTTPRYVGNGNISAPQRLSYSGKLIMEMEGTYELGWANGDVLDEIKNVEKKSGAYLKEVPETDYQTYDETRDSYVIRMDFADEYMAGLESLVSSPDERANIKALKLPDLLYVTVYYEDIYGDIQQANIPVISNVLQEGAGLDGRINGIAQQGEQIAFTAYLYGFKKLITDETKSDSGISVTLGMKQVTEKCYIKYPSSVFYDIYDNLEYSTGWRVKRAESIKDAVSLTSIAMYHSTEVQLKAAITDNELKFSFANANWDASVPAYYYRYTKSSGCKIEYNKTRKFVMKDNTAEKSVMKPVQVDTSTLYLVKIDTSDIKGASTTDDLNISFSYKTIGASTYVGSDGQNASLSNVSGGIHNSTKVYSIKEKVREFYGYWSAKGTDPEDYAYHRGTLQGGELYFLISLSDVDSFTSATVSKEGTKEWQMSGITISRVTSMDNRKIAITQKDMHTVEWGGNTTQTDREITRDITTQQIAASSEQVLVRSGKKKTIYFDESKSTIETDESEQWDPKEESISYATACSDLGFGNSRNIYDVDVVVAGSAAANSTDGDCGSKNLFFFRLNFENGSSAFVQANQQLSSDGFRTGQTERFTVKTNQDYGELTSVDIIPDDTASNSDIYDKLNIAKIRVSKQGSNALNRAWEISNPGWIGIDYVEEGDGGNTDSENGRYAGELINSFPVSNTTYSVRLLFAITNADYKKGDQKEVNPFSGSVKAVLNYMDVNNEPQSITFDLVKQMYEYNQMQVNSGDEVTIDGQPCYPADKEWMFRSDTTDRFFLDLADVKSVENLELTVVDRNGATWNIENVGVSLVSETGQMILNDKNEYVYTGQTSALTTQNSLDSPAYSVSVSSRDKDTFTIDFLPNEIKIESSSTSASAKVTRKPSGNNDSLNMYIIPTEESREQMSSYDMGLSFRYVNAYGGQYVNGVNSLKKSAEAYYIEGISTRNFSTLDAIRYKATTSNKDAPDLVGQEMIVQQVRSGVLLNTYRANLNNRSLKNPDSSVAFGKYTGNRTQTVSLYFGEKTKTEQLKDEGKNIAVSIGFETTIGGRTQTCHSPYVFLTDEQYEEIHAGMIADVNFHIPYVSRITDVRVSGINKVSAELAGILVTTYKNDKSDELTVPTAEDTQQTWDKYQKDKEAAIQGRTCDGYYGTTAIAESDRMLSDQVTTISNFRSDVNESGTLTPVTVMLEADDNTVDADVDLDLTIQYQKKGEEQGAEKTFDGLKKWLGSDSSFGEGKSLTFQCMLSDVETITGLKLKTTASNKFYSLKSVNVSWDKFYIDTGNILKEDRMTKSSSVGEIITDEAYTINFVNAKLNVTAASRPADGSSGITMSSKDSDDMNLLLKKGDQLDIDVSYVSSMEKDSWTYEIYALADNSSDAARAAVAEEKKVVKKEEDRLVIDTGELESGSYLVVIKGSLAEVSYQVRFTVKDTTAEDNSGTGKDSSQENPKTEDTRTETTEQEKETEDSGKSMEE